MANKEFDVIVIGAGPGGYVAAIRAAQLGLKTACVEKRKTLGGTCLNVGCIPSKALLQSTESLAWLHNHSQEHGILFEKLSYDFSAMQARKDGVVQGLTGGIAELFKKHQISAIQGTARFLSPQQIQVNGKEILEAKHFILATGSEPIPLPFLPFDETQVVSSTGALNLPRIPKSLVVVGAGVIGVELASVYQRLGTKITIVEMLEKICATLDDAIGRALQQELKKQGLTFLLNSKVASAKQSPNGIILTIERQGKTEELSADVVLVAVGRRPYSEGLGLDAIGITVNRGFVPVNSHFRTSQPHILAIGDLIEGPMLAHRASQEGYAAAEILAGHAAHVNEMAIPSVIYTHPEAAGLGLTEQEAKVAGLEIAIGTAYYRGNPRARCSGDIQGLVKVIGTQRKGDHTYRLVGMHMIGPHVSEMINLGVIAIETRATLEQLADAPIAHPTYSEVIKEACGNALRRAVH